MDTASLSVPSISPASLRARPRFASRWHSVFGSPMPAGDEALAVGIAKVLAASRLKELARVKIIKRGGSGGARYDISDLSATFYGRKILEGLSHDRRRKALTSDEFTALQAACAKIKLTLPEAVEPTTTELFFDDVQVPAANLLGDVEGRGFAQLMEQLPRERLIVAVGSLAIRRRSRSSRPRPSICARW